MTRLAPTRTPSPALSLTLTLTQVAEQAAEFRETKTEPQSKDQLARIMRIEVMMAKVMFNP